MLAVIGGGILGVGLIWLLTEAVLRYSASHGVGIVMWREKWPTDGAGRSGIQGRLDAAQDRELRSLKRLRAIPVALIVIGAVLIIVGAVGQ